MTKQIELEFESEQHKTAYEIARRVLDKIGIVPIQADMYREVSLSTPQYKIQFRLSSTDIVNLPLSIDELAVNKSLPQETMYTLERWQREAKMSNSLTIDVSSPVNYNRYANVSSEKSLASLGNEYIFLDLFYRRLISIGKDASKEEQGKLIRDIKSFLKNNRIEINLDNKSRRISRIMRTSLDSLFEVDTCITGHGGKEAVELFLKSTKYNFNYAYRDEVGRKQFAHVGDFNLTDWNNTSQLGRTVKYIDDLIVNYRKKVNAGAIVEGE